MIAELQVLPSPPGTQADRWAYVDAAIDAIAASGLAHEVGPLGTNFEGDADRVWAAARAAHEAAAAAGADAVTSVLKLYQAAGAGARPMAELTAAHRAARP